MDIYIQLYILRINLLLCLSIAACGADAHRPSVTRVWPGMGTMMSAAAWGADSTRVARALEAAHDSVDHIDSLIQRRVESPHSIPCGAQFVAVPESRSRATASRPDMRSSAPRWRSAMAWTARCWIWAANTAGWRRRAPTHRTVGIPDPDNTLRMLASVDLLAGSVGRSRGATRRAAPRARSRCWLPTR